MGARTSGREAALQMLYALDVGREAGVEGREAGTEERAPGDTEERAPVDTEVTIREYWREIPGDIEGRPFADQLVRATTAELDAIDKRIREASKHWRLERMARVDRNVLRLGVHELTSGDDTPRAVIIDEAVELAKRFGAEGSSVFVNGVLDRIAEEVGRS